MHVIFLVVLGPKSSFIQNGELFWWSLFEAERWHIRILKKERKGNMRASVIDSPADSFFVNFKKCFGGCVCVIWIGTGSVQVDI